MKRMPGFNLLCMLGLTALLAGGCTPAAPVAQAPDEEHASHGHSHDEAPDSYSEAVAKLESLATQIKDAFAGNDLDKAHGPLHEVGHILEVIPALAEKEAFSDERKASIKQAVESLFQSFTAIDEAFHGGEGKTYDQVSGDVDTSMSTLKAN